MTPQKRLRYPHTLAVFFLFSLLSCSCLEEKSEDDQTSSAVIKESESQLPQKQVPPSDLALKGVEQSYVPPPTIHRNDLGNFVGKIVSTSHGFNDARRLFVSYTLADVTDYGLIFELFPLSFEEIEQGTRIVTLHTSIVIKNRDLVVAVLSVFDPDKLQGGYLTLWQIVGDSLNFKSLHDIQLWGSETIQYREFPDSSLLLALKSWFADGGDYEVSYRFFRYDRKDEVELIYEKDYEYSDFYDHIKPSYNLLNDETLIVRIIERHFTGMFDETGNPLPKEEENRFVRADTFYVDLWELVTERSDK